MIMNQGYMNSIISISKKLVFVALFGYFVFEVNIAMEKEERKGV